MDIASAVYTLTVTIVDFIGEHEDKDAVTEQIANIAVQIQSIIRPLRLYDLGTLKISSPSPTSSVTQVLESIQKHLRQIDEHLRSWKERRSRRLLALVNPWAVTQQLKDDREQLMNQYILLMGSMQVVDFVKGYNLLQPSLWPPQETTRSLKVPTTPTKDFDSESVQDVSSAPAGESEVECFWYEHIGREVDIADSLVLCDVIVSWLEHSVQEDLGSVARRRLLLRLDENNLGQITLSTLKAFVSDRDFKDVVRTYTSDPLLPLLVWIDDDIKENDRKVQYALKCNVAVVQLSSTASAKAWIDINRDFLKKHDNASEIRYISDQVRFEFSNGSITPIKNLNAGTEMATYIRETQHLTAPLLIYTSEKSLPFTTYIEKWPWTGSMAGDDSGYRRFVGALGKRRNDDLWWIGRNICLPPERQRPRSSEIARIQIPQKNQLQVPQTHLAMGLPRSMPSSPTPPSDLVPLLKSYQSCSRSRRLDWVLWDSIYVAGERVWTADSAIPELLTENADFLLKPAFDPPLPEDFMASISCRRPLLIKPRWEDATGSASATPFSLAVLRWGSIPVWKPAPSAIPNVISSTRESSEKASFLDPSSSYLSSLPSTSEFDNQLRIVDILDCIEQWMFEPLSLHDWRGLTKGVHDATLEAYNSRRMFSQPPPHVELLKDPLTPEEASQISTLSPNQNSVSESDVARVDTMRLHLRWGGLSVDEDFKHNRTLYLTLESVEEERFEQLRA